MPSGLGPIAILPGMRQLWGNITGNPLDPNQTPDAQNWFGTNPMVSAGQWQDYARMGGGVASGPQGMTYRPTQSPLGDFTDAATNAALYGGSYNPMFGQSAFQRFADWDRPAGTLGAGDLGGSYQRRFATDLYDQQGNIVGLSPEHSAGLRSFQTYGGRDAAGNAMTGVNNPINQTFGGLLALQQGANPYLNNPTLAAQMSQYQELGSPFARATPSAYLSGALAGEASAPSTASIAGQYVEPAARAGQVSVEDMARMAGRSYQGTVGDVTGMTNSYEQQLLDQMAQQGSKDLSLGLQDAQSTLSSMGLGRSGQGQSTAAGVWEDIQQKNALDRQNLMAQFRQAAMDREAQTMTQMGMGALGANQAAILAQQEGGINALLNAQQAASQGNEQRLQRANAAIMQGLQGQYGSLEASRAAERAGLAQGMDRTGNWNTNIQQQYLQSMLGSDEAMRQRMQMEAQGQSQGMRDYMMLQQYRDQGYDDRQANMLMLADRARQQEQARLSQMQQFSQMPLQTLIQMITGIQPTQMASPQGTNWGQMLGQGAINYGTNLLGQMGSYGKEQNEW